MDDSEPAPPSDLASWNARLIHIFISPGHDYWGRNGEGRMQHGISDVAEVECVAGMGLRGDRYFNSRPDAKGQVTFFDMRIVREVRRHFKLPKLPASVFRRNLIVEGVDLDEWIGKRFLFQGIEFEGSQECRPCEWMDRVIAPGGEEFLKGRFRGGLRAKVRSSGMLRTR
ncbi:MAG: molybdenum cofactor biosysynthesis protein [Verrucomicrobiaceae bacterium]|nr:MAG: molybdenum cofactor biosysynthesis protein [Verrucomicrobiaceae bacterium]